MPYVTSFERSAMLQLIEDSLHKKFGEAGLKLVPAISELNDAEKYRALNLIILTANSLDEVRKACTKATAAARRTRKAGNGKRGSSKA